MFNFNWPPTKPVEEVIGEALGAASMCWEPKPEGVFQSEDATEIINKLHEWLELNYREK